MVVLKGWDIWSIKLLEALYKRVDVTWKEHFAEPFLCFRVVQVSPLLERIE